MKTWESKLKELLKIGTLTDSTSDGEQSYTFETFDKGAYCFNSIKQTTDSLKSFVHLVYGSLFN